MPDSTKSSLPHVGKAKFKILKGQSVLPQYLKNSSKSPGGVGVFLVDENEPDKPPPFNVLPVRVAAPALLASPFMLTFLRTCREASELLRPLTRLGLPQTSVHSKCPYWSPGRECPDGALNTQLQALLRGRENGLMFKHPAHKVAPVHYYTGPINAAHIVLFNISLLWYIGSYANRQ